MKFKYTEISSTFQRYSWTTHSMNIMIWFTSTAPSLILNSLRAGNTVFPSGNNFIIPKKTCVVFARCGTHLLARQLDLKGACLCLGQCCLQPGGPVSLPCGQTTGDSKSSPSESVNLEGLASWVQVVAWPNLPGFLSTLLPAWWGLMETCIALQILVSLLAPLTTCWNLNSFHLPGWPGHNS